MKKILLTLLCLIGVSAVYATETADIVFTFDGSSWTPNLPTASSKEASTHSFTYNNATYSLQLKYAKLYSSTILWLDKNKGTVTLPAFDRKVTKIVLKTPASSSGSLGNASVKLTATGLTEQKVTGLNEKGKEFTFAIPDAEQAVGTIYTLAECNNKNAQIASISIFLGVEETGEETGLAWSKDSFDATIGETNAFPTLTNPNGLSVTYDSSDKTVATIDNEGNITLVGEGKTEISANFVSDGTYKSDNVIYTLNVTDPSNLEIFGSADGSEFKFDDIMLPESSTYVWKHDTQYLKASAYINKTNLASKSVAYIPVNLIQYKSASLSFTQAANYFKTFDNFKTYCSVVVREKGATEWAKVGEPTNSGLGSSWTWGTNDPISLDAYAGKEIEVGFMYESTTEMAGTWQIKDIYVKGAKNTDLNQVDPQLYWVVDGVEKAEYTYSLTDTPTYLNYYIGSKADNNYTFNGIEITSSNPNVAKVEDLIYVTPIAPGETTLTVSFPGDNRFLPATADLKLTVVGKPADPVFTPDEGEVEYGTKVTVKSQGATTMTYYIVYGAEGVDDVMEEVQGDTFTFTVTDDMTVTVEASNDNGSSELEKVYLVKAPQTPVFTPAAGEYPVGTKITFSSPNVNKYELSVFDSNFETLVDAQIIEGTEGEYILAQDCIINVYAILPNGKRSTVAEAEYTVSNDIVAIFDFTTEGAYGFNTTNNGGAYETEVTEIVDNTYDVKIDMSGKYRHWKKDEQYDFRTYSGATMTFIAPKDYAITRIEFLKGIDNKLAIEGVDNKVWAPAETDEYEFGVKAFNCTGISNIGGINVYLTESVDALDPAFEANATVQIGDEIKVRTQHEHHTLYYMINENVQPAAAPLRVPDVADWTKHDDAEYTYTVTKMPAVIRAKVVDRKGNESGVQILEIASDGTTSAIENITADDAQDEVEYYSLQGIRLQNPAAGSVVIRRQGSQVSKIRL